MKRCPQCNRVETDDALTFCRADRMRLVTGSLDPESSSTLMLSQPPRSAELPTQQIQSMPSIAVLPFVNMSADAENEYFCDGLAEELLNALATACATNMKRCPNAIALRLDTLPN